MELCNNLSLSRIFRPQHQANCPDNPVSWFSSQSGWHRSPLTTSSHQKSPGVSPLCPWIYLLASDWLIGQYSPHIYSAGSEVCETKPCLCWGSWTELTSNNNPSSCVMDPEQPIRMKSPGQLTNQRSTGTGYFPPISMTCASLTAACACKYLSNIQPLISGNIYFSSHIPSTVRCKLF